MTNCSEDPTPARLGVVFMNIPAWTDTKFRSNSGQDHLGALSVGANIAEDLLPGINTVTPEQDIGLFTVGLCLIS